MSAKRKKTAGIRTSLREILRWPSVLDPELAGGRRRLFVVLSLVAVLLAGHVWMRLRIQDLGYKTEYLARLIHRLDQEHRELEDEVARESSPTKLTRRARELGLRLPEPGQVRRIDGTP